MDLARHGVELLTPDADVFAPTLDGRALVLYEDAAAQRRRACGAFEREDADAYPAVSGGDRSA